MDASVNKPMSRDPVIDLLRCIGLFLVIAAHCEFPEWFYEFREFDVVLLFFVSGMSFALSHSAAEHPQAYSAYVKHRFDRLVKPVWLFLVFFFLFFRILGRPFSPSVMAKSFLLLSGGILFLWVFRIFFCTALINPFLHHMEQRVSPRIAAAGTVLGLLLNDMLAKLAGSVLSGTVYSVFEQLVSYTIAYGLIGFAGMSFIHDEESGRTKSFGIYTAAFAVSLAVRHFAPVSLAKYPPSLCYCTYGLSLGSLLYLLLRKLPLPDRVMKCAGWLSGQSMTIYMWHIFAYYLLDTAAPRLLQTGGVCWMILTGGGLLLTIVQEQVMKQIGRKRANG